MSEESRARKEQTMASDPLDRLPLWAETCLWILAVVFHVFRVVPVVVLSAMKWAIWVDHIIGGMSYGCK